MGTRRDRGSGSISLGTNGLWKVRVELPRRRDEPRRRKVVYAKTRKEAEAKLAELHLLYPPRTPQRNPRTIALAEARAKGTHSRIEWARHLKSLPRVDQYYIRCFYCYKPTHVSRIEKDHFIPVTRGGSDALENLVPACRPCNRGKFDATGFEWFEVMELSAGGWYS